MYEFEKFIKIYLYYLNSGAPLLRHSSAYGLAPSQHKLQPTPSIKLYKMCFKYQDQ